MLCPLRLPSLQSLLVSPETFVDLGLQRLHVRKVKLDLVAYAGQQRLELRLLCIGVFGDVGEEEVGMAVEEQVGVLDVGIALVVDGLVGDLFSGQRGASVRRLSSHLAQHVLCCAQRHVERYTGHMVEGRRLLHNLLDALWRAHSVCVFIKVGSCLIVWWGWGCCGGKNDAAAKVRGQGRSCRFFFVATNHAGIRGSGGKGSHSIAIDTRREDCGKSC